MESPQKNVAARRHLPAGLLGVSRRSPSCGSRESPSNPPTLNGGWDAGNVSRDIIKTRFDGFTLRGDGESRTNFVRAWSQKPPRR